MPPDWLKCVTHPVSTLSNMTVDTPEMYICKISSDKSLEQALRVYQELCYFVSQIVNLHLRLVLSGKTFIVALYIKAIKSGCY